MDPGLKEGCVAVIAELFVLGNASLGWLWLSVSKQEDILAPFVLCENDSGPKSSNLTSVIDKAHILSILLPLS